MPGRSKKTAPGSPAQSAVGARSNSVPKAKKLPAESFKRLVDTGMRLNELRGAEELQQFLIDQVTELSGARRVLLVLNYFP